MAVKKIEADLIVNGAIKKLGGTSFQFLKANGDVDNTSYLPLTQGMPADFIASFTVSASNRGSLHVYNSASAGNATIVNTGANIGDRYDFVQWGTGKLTLVGSGVTLRSAETLITRKQYSVISVIKITATEWLVTGDLQLL